MRPHYDFRGGVRGKYASRYRAGTNVVVLDPDVAAVFPDAAAVNRALRTYWMSYHLAERGGGAPNSRLDRTGQRRPVSLSVRPSGMLGDDLKVVAIADGVAFFARDWTLARPVDLALLQSTS
jgi:hypothetical protein